MSEKIGFIGLGVMGGHMARHLSEKYALTVFDVDSDRVTALNKAESAANVRQVGQGAEIVLLSLPSSQIVEQVIIGDQGLMSVMRKGSLVIDTSMTEPTVSKKIAARLVDQGIEFMDVPVSGGGRCGSQCVTGSDGRGHA